MPTVGWTRLCWTALLAQALLVLLVLVPAGGGGLVQAALLEDASGLVVLAGKQAQRARPASQPVAAEPCNIYANEGLHVVLDRICTLCHEMYSDSNPNMRAQCR